MHVTFKADSIAKIIINFLLLLTIANKFQISSVILIASHPFTLLKTLILQHILVFISSDHETLDGKSCKNANRRKKENADRLRKHMDNFVSYFDLYKQNPKIK